jgi:hypothetical protein
MTALKAAAIKERTHRLIASRHPTVGVIDDIAANPSDLRDAFILEALTNDRLAAAAGRIGNLPDTEIITGVSGSGASLVMAAFLHADEAGGRFTDGRLGGWYAALSVDTSIRETLHHGTLRLSKSAGGFPNRIQMRELIANINSDLVDIRGQQATRPDLYHLDDYSRSQAFAAGLRWPKSPPAANGIVFDSVRHAGGTNVCIFWPSKVPLPIVQGDHYEYYWDAHGTASVAKLTQVAIR